MAEVNDHTMAEVMSLLEAEPDSRVIRCQGQTFQPSMKSFQFWFLQAKQRKR